MYSYEQDDEYSDTEDERESDEEIYQGYQNIEVQGDTRNYEEQMWEYQRGLEEQRQQQEQQGEYLRQQGEYMRQVQASLEQKDRTTKTI